LALIRIYLTGEVCIEGVSGLIREADFPRRQGRLAFVFLASERKRTVGRDELADVLWPAQLPLRWEMGIAALVSKLRALLERAGLERSAIATAFGCYQLKLPAETWVDVDGALDQLHTAEGALRAGTPAAGYGAAVVAAAILRRPFLPGADGAWVDTRREALTAARARALECLIELHAWNREPGLAVQVAEELLRLEPYRESGWRSLIRLHAEAGNQAQALHEYERCRALLKGQLGVEPAQETLALVHELALEGTPPA
jgi:DNA-binding SARP family transcriptional activator